jgi:SAM-dependent methyltransferase
MHLASPLAGTSHPTNGAPSSQWVERWVPYVETGSWGLDLACGDGRNTGVLLRHGLRVAALDRDAAALEQLAKRYRGQSFGRLLQIDLEAQPWQPELWVPKEGFGLILTCNYLWRARQALVLNGLRPGGWWIHETFMRGHEHLGRPRSPDFLLEPGELLAWAAQAQLRVIGFEQGECAGAIVQRIAAQRVPSRSNEVITPSQAAGQWPLIG